MAEGERFEHGSVLGGKTRATRVSSQWKSTGMGKTVLKENHALARFIDELNEEIDSLVKALMKRIETHDRNTQFRAGFTDTLMVYVLGKVKAG